MGGEFLRIVLEDGGMMGKLKRVGSGEGRFCGTFFFQCGHWCEGSMYVLGGELSTFVDLERFIFFLKYKVIFGWNQSWKAFPLCGLFPF